MTLTDYVELLENYEGPQCTGHTVLGEQCCALGVIAKKLEPGIGRYTILSSRTIAVIENIKKKAQAVGVHIIDMNDNHKLTFKEIAAKIREKL